MKARAQGSRDDGWRPDGSRPTADKPFTGPIQRLRRPLEEKLADESLRAALPIAFLKMTTSRIRNLGPHPGRN